MIHYHVLFPLLSELACKLWRFRVIALAPEVFAIFLTKSRKFLLHPAVADDDHDKMMKIVMILIVKKLIILLTKSKKIPALDEEGRSRIFPQLVRHNLNIS